MRNHIYEVDWNYPDVIESGDTTWRDLHQYIVVYDSNSELGKVIYEEIMDSDEAYFARVDEALMKSFGIKDEDVAFYYGTTKEMTDDELIEAIKADGEIVITQIYNKFYEEDNQ